MSWGLFKKSQSPSPPKNQIEVVCPACGAAQYEPRLVVSTFCKRCGVHLSIVKKRVIASDVSKSGVQIPEGEALRKQLPKQPPPVAPTPPPDPAGVVVPGPRASSGPMRVMRPFSGLGRTPVPTSKTKAPEPEPEPEYDDLSETGELGLGMMMQAASAPRIRPPAPEPEPEFEPEPGIGDVFALEPEPEPDFEPEPEPAPAPPPVAAAPPPPAARPISSRWSLPPPRAERQPPPAPKAEAPVEEPEPEAASPVEDGSTAEDEPVPGPIPVAAMMRQTPADRAAASPVGTLQKMKDQGFYRQQYFKEAQCFDCNHKFKVGRSSRSANCPSCGAYISLEDVELNMPSSQPIKTRGDVLIRKRGQLTATHLYARDLRCQGTVSANIHCSGDAIFRTTGTIVGEVHCRRFIVEKGSNLVLMNPVHADEVEIHSPITGNVFSKGPVLISANGAVNGDVTARSVSIEPGGELNGAMNIVRSTPSK